MKHNTFRFIALLICLNIFNIGCESLKAARQKEFRFSKSWTRHTVGEDYIQARISHTMTPVFVDDMVIQGNEIDGISAYHRKTGRLVWRKFISGGVASSAKLDGHNLYFGGGDGYFYAINSLNGQSLWTFPIKSEGIGTPNVEGDVVYFLSGNNSAYALKKDTGEQIWYYNRMDPASISVRGASEPTIADNKVLFGFSDGSLVALDKKTGSIVWEKNIGTNPKFKDVDSKPILDGQTIYVSSYDGKLYALQLKDGSEKWSYDDGGFHPVLLQGDAIYFSTSSSSLVALEKDSGKQYWKVALNKTVGTEPSFFRGLIIVGEWQGLLKAFDARTGKLVTTFNTGRGVTSKATLDDTTGEVYVMTVDANLFALKLDFVDSAAIWPWEK